MDQAASGNGPIKTIRVDDAEIESILDNLDTAASATGTQTTERYPYRHKQIRAEIQQPGDASSSSYYVRPRSLGEDGMSFLHGGFVHPGSKCLVELVTVHGSWKNVQANAVACRFIQHNLHEVDVHFQHSIDPSEYSRDAVHTSVLLVDDDPSITRLAKAFLSKLNADVDHAENGQEAIDKAKSKVYDLILMDIEMPVLNGLEAAKTLRGQGYSGTIVAATALTEPADRQKCLEAGFDDYIPKPYVRENLATVLKSIEQEPIFSTLSDDPTMKDIIHAFVTELPSKIRGIEEAIANQNTQVLSTVVRGLKAEGTGYGFECISEAAAKVEKELIQGTDIADVRRSVDSLLKLCLQVRSAARVTPPTDEPTEDMQEATA